MSKVYLGEYIFDTSSNSLFLNDKELEAEPKVLEVLAYLCAQRDRYVSLNELHEQVWRGRIVSDTAVRGTIKKLRNLLNDVDIAEPRYIKSQSKRGYKLICLVSPVRPATAAVSPLELTEADPAVWELAGGYAETIGTPLPGRRRRVPLRHLVMGLISLLLLAAAYGFWTLQPAVNSAAVAAPKAVAELLQTVGGEKRGLAISPDGTQLAFIGRKNISEPWQIYLLHRQTKELRLLSATIQQPTKLLFESNQSLFVISQILGNSSLFRLSLTAQSQDNAQPLLSLPVISHLSRDSETNSWLLNAVEPGHSSVMLYRWTPASGALQMIQTSDSSVAHIYQSVLSPSSERLANMVLNGQQHQLEVRERATGKIVTSYVMDGLVHKVEWLSDDVLLALGNKGLSKMDIRQDVRLVLTDTAEEDVIDFVVAASAEQLYLLKNNYTEDLEFYEISVESGKKTGLIINTANGTQSVNYTTADRVYFTVQKQQELRTLVRYDQNNSSSETLFSTDQRLELLDHHAAQDLLLLRVGAQLVVVNVKRAAVDVVTSSQNYLDPHAAFSPDGGQVFYGQLVAGNWEVHKYDRQQRQSSRLIAGFRSLRQLPDGYVAADVDGQLFRLDSTMQTKTALQHKISIEHVSRWYVRGQRLIWSDFNFDTTWLKQLDLVSGELKQLRFPFEKTRPRFALDPNGGKGIFYSRGAQISHLHVIGFNHANFQPFDFHTDSP